MKQRQFDGILDGAHCLLLAADFLPRQLGNGIEEIILRMRPGEQLDGDAVIRIHAHFIADLDLPAQDFPAALKDDGLRPVLGADSQTRPRRSPR